MAAEKPLYIIHWRSDITGHEGHGTKGFPAEEAKRLCKEMNEEQRHLRCYHWMEPMEQ